MALHLKRSNHCGCNIPIIYRFYRFNRIETFLLAENCVNNMSSLTAHNNIASLCSTQQLSRIYNKRISKTDPKIISMNTTTHTPSKDL